MKNHLPILLVGLCAIALAATAQTSSKRSDTPARTIAPARPQPQPAASPFLPAPTPAAPLLPSPSIRVLPRPFNLDTALARLLADLKAVTATGEFELSVTNAGKVEVTRLPLTLHTMEGRVRTELDISVMPGRVDSDGPFAPFRQVGITRLVNLTVFNTTVRFTHQLFPEVRARVTQPLPPEELPFLIRMEKRSLGSDSLNGVPSERFTVTLSYPGGDKREARWWQAATGTPQQVQFDVGDSLITVRFRSVQNLSKQDPKEASLRNATIFALPGDFSEYPDVGYMLQGVSARQARGKR